MTDLPSLPEGVLMSTTLVVITFNNGSLKIVRQEGESVLEIKVDDRVVYSNPVLQAPVANLGLSERAFHCLKRANIHTVGELIKRSSVDLVSISMFGEKCLDEVTEKLLTMGLILSPTDYVGS